MNKNKKYVVYGVSIDGDESGRMLVCCTSNYKANKKVMKSWIKARDTRYISRVFLNVLGDRSVDCLVFEILWECDSKEEAMYYKWYYCMEVVEKSGGEDIDDEGGFALSGQVYNEKLPNMYKFSDEWRLKAIEHTV